MAIIDKIIQKRDECMARHGESSVNCVFLDVITYFRVCTEYERVSGNSSKEITNLLGLDVHIQHADKEVIEFGYSTQRGKH